jgi:hypothetical protein
VPLGLDLSESRAKIERAAAHLQALDAELPAIRDRNPIALRFTEIDPNTGWCEVFGRWQHIKEPKVSVLAGDYIHNLRSALDYMVTVLVDASDARLRTIHEFPIFTDPEAYSRKVGTVHKARSGGPLHGVTYGLGVIEEVQPYHMQPEPERHPLAQLYRLSNTDKHRQALVLSERMGRPQMTFDFSGVAPVERWFMPEWGLAVDKDTKIAAFRFEPPYPGAMSVEPGELIPLLGAPAFPPKYPDGLLLAMDPVEGLQIAVVDVLVRLEAL